MEWFDFTGDSGHNIQLLVCCEFHIYTKWANKNHNHPPERTLIFGLFFKHKLFITYQNAMGVS